MPRHDGSELSATDAGPRGGREGLASSATPGDVPNE
jgi:hypothetical protein